MERWADEGIVTEKELAAAQGIQAIFDRAQLRELYAASSSLIDRVDGLCKRWIDGPYRVGRDLIRALAA
tara:strand:+ start:2249 stop:2455 length:207 start_codon:yes stop_codon:yes gene_type:complete